MTDFSLETSFKVSSIIIALLVPVRIYFIKEKSRKKYLFTKINIIHATLAIGSLLYFWEGSAMVAMLGYALFVS